MLDTITHVPLQTTVQPTNDVDRLGALNAAIAELEAEALGVKDRIKAKGAGTYDGELFQAKVSIYSMEKRDDVFKGRIKEAVDEFVASLDSRYVKKHSYTDEVVRLSIKSR